VTTWLLPGFRAVGGVVDVQPWTAVCCVSAEHVGVLGDHNMCRSHHVWVWVWPGGFEAKSRAPGFEVMEHCVACSVGLCGAVTRTYSRLQCCDLDWSLCVVAWPQAILALTRPPRSPMPRTTAAQTTATAVAAQLHALEDILQWATLAPHALPANGQLMVAALLLVSLPHCFQQQLCLVCSTWC
jgi:hypothetical protein